MMGDGGDGNVIEEEKKKRRRWNEENENWFRVIRIIMRKGSFVTYSLGVPLKSLKRVPLKLGIPQLI